MRRRAATRKVESGGGRQLATESEARTHVLEVNETDPGGGQWRELQPRLFHEGTGCDDMSQPGELHARQHDHRPGGEIEHGGHATQRPQAEQRQWRGIDVGEEHANAGGVRWQQFPPYLREDGRATEEPPVGQTLGDVPEGADAGAQPGGLDDGLRHSARAEFHLGAKLLFEHPVAEPRGEPVARRGHGEVLEARGRHRLAEMDGDAREETFPVAVGGRREPVGAPEIRGDDPGVGAVQEKPGAVEQLHERPGLGHASLGEKHEPAAGAQVLGHVLGRIG